MRLTPGTLLAGRYRVSTRLGEGGMGEVWAARHELTGKAVALKRLICAAGERGFGEARARFALEAKSACAVEHPSVVEVFDFIDDEAAGPLIVMELLAGETLAARLARGPLGSARQVCELMLPVVSAVGTAHERGIVHRDLKPSNIFIAARPGPGRENVKVLDFGIAKWLAGARDERGLSTRTGSTLGTPSYMAPEQATADRSADHRVDVWSIGVMLYEAASGVRPVEGDNAAQLVMRLLSTGIIPIEQLVPELPPELAALIGRMLSREVGRRPQDLREVYATLRALSGTDSLSFGAPHGTLALGADQSAVTAAPERPPGPASVARSQPLSPAPPTHTSVDVFALTARAPLPDARAQAGAEETLELPAGGAPAPSAAPARGHAPSAGDALAPEGLAAEPAWARSSGRRRGLFGAALAATACIGAALLVWPWAEHEASRAGVGAARWTTTPPLAHAATPSSAEPAAGSPLMIDAVRAPAPASAPQAAPEPASNARLSARAAAKARSARASSRRASGAARAAAVTRKLEHEPAAAPGSLTTGALPPASDTHAAAASKPRGAECERSSECHSQLCVAFACE